MTRHLKPCALCGCTKVPMLRGNGAGDNWLECYDCGMSTRLREDGAGSEKDWNRRPETAEPEARLTTLERICAGITDEMIDGGWTALGLSKHAKKLEDRLAVRDGQSAEQERDAAWFAVAMNAAAYIETAAISVSDPEAKRAAEGAAEHARSAAQKLWQARAALSSPASVSAEKRGVNEHEIKWPEGYCRDPNGKICVPKGKDVDFNFGYDLGYYDAMSVKLDAIADFKKLLIKGSTK